MTSILASSTTLWYLARGTGIVTLVFLTVSVLLGIVTSYRWSTPAWPRFVIEFVHRNVSLLVVAFLAAHVVTVVTDAYAPIGWKDAVVPFLSPYRPFWLGLGALALDLVIALVATSLLRHRIGYATWRLIHWFAYLCWPVAVLHGIGTGSDTKLSVVLVITAACVLTVLAAAAARLVWALAGHATMRRSALGAFTVAPVLLAIWMASGPLASGWARKAGTPANVIAATQRAAGSASTSAPHRPSNSTSSPNASNAFTARVQGTLRQSNQDAQGLVTVSLVGSLHDGATGTLDVELHGRPLSNGGIELENGSVTLVNGSTSDRSSGPVTGLRGNAVVADVADSSGARLGVSVEFTALDPERHTMAGIVNVSNGRGDDLGGDR